MLHIFTVFRCPGDHLPTHQERISNFGMISNFGTPQKYKVTHTALLGGFQGWKADL